MTSKKRKRKILLSNKILVDIWGSHDTEWNPDEVFQKIEKVSKVTNEES